MKKLKTKIIISLLLAMCSFTTSFADSGYVFKGEIGKYPIVLTIWATAAFADGEYYYVSQGKNKPLKLQGNYDTEGYEDDVWYFTETVNGKRNGAFKLKWRRSVNNGYKRMTGTYVNIKGNSYYVNLTCVKVINNPDHI